MENSCFHLFFNLLSFFSYLSILSPFSSKNHMTSSPRLTKCLLMAGKFLVIAVNALLVGSGSRLAKGWGQQSSLSHNDAIYSVA